jgi:hypothetical protein
MHNFLIVFIFPIIQKNIGDNFVIIQEEKQYEPPKEEMAVETSPSDGFK